MTKKRLIASGTLSATGGLGALALVLGLAAMPVDAFAQEHGRGHSRGGGNSAESSSPRGGGGGQRWNGGGGGGQRSHSGGGEASSGRRWNGGGGQAGGGWRARSSDSGGGAAQSAPHVRAQPRWSGGDGAGWRSRQGDGDTSVTRGRPRQDDGGGRRGAWNGGTTYNAPAVRQAEPSNPSPRVERKRWQGGDRQWSGRERNQQDTARQRDWRRDRHERQRAETLRNRRDDGQTWRERNNTERWRNNNNWRDNDGWRNSDGSRHHSSRQRYSGSNEHRRWDRDWRRDNRYDWSGYRNTHRHIYRMGTYHAPYRHWRYRRLYIGFQLDSLFYSNRYWIDDPWYYRLPPVYGPYRWIRYYDDALLVNIYTGEVVDVIEDFFW